MTTFLEDLFRSKEGDKPPCYFFGIIYTQKTEDEDVKTIIDGQQRLTTVVTLLAVIRDELDRLEKPAMVENVDEFLHTSDDKRHPRLTLNTRNDRFFQSSILKPDNPSSKIERMLDPKPHPANLRLAVAYSTIYNKLRANYEQSGGIDYDNYLLSVQTHLLKQFIVVENVLEGDEDAVHTIFETVNRRGVQLNDSDHVKNRILRIAQKQDDRYREELNSKWLDLMEILEGIRIASTMFLRHYLIAYHYPEGVERVPPEDEVTDRIFALADREGQDPISFVDHLIEKAEDYRFLRDPTIRFKPNANLNALTYLSSHVVYPVLLVGKSRLSSDDFVELSKYVLHYFFRARTIGSAEANSIEKVIAEAAQLLREKGDVGSIRQLLAKSSTNPGDDQFKAKFSVCTAKGKKALYILSELNKKLAGTFDTTSTPTVEHIMPTKISATPWIAEIAKAIGTTNESEINLNHARNLNRLGNLTMLSSKRNSKNKNLSFMEKRKNVYDNDTMKITTMLSKWNEWNEQAISKRQEQFANLALDIWRL